MINKANPPPHLRLPQSIQKNQELAKVLGEMNFNMFLLWKKLGGGADFIDENSQLQYEFDDISPFLFSFSTGTDSVVTTNIDYTTSGRQIIICTAALSVTLNSEPKDMEEAKIKISNGDVTILGNGRLVDNETDITVIFNNVQGLAVIDLIYTIDTDSWWVL